MLSNRKEGEAVELKKRREAIEEAVKRLLDEENAVNSADPHCYSKTAAFAFEEIQSILDEGVRFEKILNSFVISGMLPEGANLHSFRQAFWREKKRRRETDESTKGTVVPAAKQEVVRVGGRLPKERDDRGMTGEGAKTYSDNPAVSENEPAAQAGLRINPDNTFVIRPIDLNDLPDIRNLKNMKKFRKAVNEK